MGVFSCSACVHMEESTSIKFSLEESLQRLEQIVLELERGDQELDKALASYEEGVKLARRCLESLKAAELKIEELSGFEDEA